MFLLDVLSTDRTYLSEKLSGCRFGTPDIVQQMTDIFDNSAKLRFHSPNDPSYIKFGTVRDRDPQYNIRNGQLKLDGQVYVLGQSIAEIN